MAMNKQSWSLTLLVVLCTMGMVHLCHAQNSPQDYLNPHNAARTRLNVGPLTWDDNVAAFAQNYANQRARDCNLIHSGGPYGENLFGGSGADFSAADAVNAWVNEKADYDYNSNTCAAGKQCGHYTQVVWRNSVRLGCAKVRCNNGGIFITCNYNPPGNFIGQKPY
ncbi:hypothetical protein AMTRI_Chr08g202500 [Amborella trichopoda]|uniref:SCP domain-containing protein n=1 Tax=Amborella trichopoda TaxID=13333 RepID=W1PNJ4_AMBTC|nr:pathogenesis-related protein PRB1-2 [Amborella trichopoda]ERN09638.1 hypothetical protein AMTR_s00029p00197310 [Amborella trichopoda]|eukprot:XP_006848057.1 pathogenesis-related protein PRB1-2 [Amborella trichopoda]